MTRILLAAVLAVAACTAPQQPGEPEPTAPTVPEITPEDLTRAAHFALDWAEAFESVYGPEWASKLKPWQRVAIAGSCMNLTRLLAAYEGVSMEVVERAHGVCLPFIAAPDMSPAPAPRPEPS